MKTKHFILGFAMLLILITQIYAGNMDLIKISNPQLFTDFVRTSNFSGYNITAMNLSGWIACSDIYQDGSGADSDFCNDINGGAGSGAWPLHPNGWVINNSDQLDWNVTKGDERYVTIVYLDNQSIVRDDNASWIRTYQYQNETARMDLIYDYVITNRSEWDLAYSWGNHADAGYITSYENLTGNDVVGMVGNWSADKPDYQIWSTTKSYIDSLGNWSAVSSLYKVWTETKSYIDSLGNWTADKGDYYTSIEVDSRTNRSWNQSLADILYADISVTGDNSSWNQSLADTLYADISVVDTNDTVDVEALKAENVTLHLRTNTINSSVVVNTADITVLKAENVSLHGMVSDANDTAVAKASPGDCPEGSVVMNTTTSGVECVVMSVGGGTTPHELNGSNHTGVLDSIRVQQNDGTYFLGVTQQAINDLLFGYISGLAYIPSHLGTSDGATDASVTWQSTTSSYVADCAGSSLADGGWDDSSAHPVTTDGSFDADINNDFYELTAYSNISIYINDAQMDDTQLDGTTSPPDSTNIVIDNEGTNELGIVYGQLDANIPLSSMTQKGYADIWINHTNVSGSASYSDSTELFYDTGSAPTTGATSIEENTYSSNKAVSGIYYYSDGDTFNVSIASSSNVFAYSYPSNVIGCEYSYNGFGGGTTNYAFSDAGISGDSSPPAWDDAITFVKEPAFTVAGNNHDNDATIRCRALSSPRSSGSYTYSSSGPYLVNSYGTTSSALLEYFDDEYYRLPEGDYDSTGFGTTGQWTSTSCLTDGQAMLQLGRLDYPHTDWSSKLPPENTCDYSAFSENANYTRALVDAGNPHTSISLTLSPLTSSDIDYSTGTVKVWVKLPTQTGWLDVGKAYDGGTFTGSDGDGCQTSESSSTFGCTFGGFSTANSDYLIVIKKIMESGTSEYVEAISTNW